MYDKGDFTSIPKLEFTITIGLDKNKDDYLTNIVPFMSIGDVEASEVIIVARYELVEATDFFSQVKSFFSKEAAENINVDNQVLISGLKEIIRDNSSLFQLRYYNHKGQVINDFQLNQLIRHVAISSKNLESVDELSKAFGKIARYRYEEKFPEDRLKLEEELTRINQVLMTDVYSVNTKTINVLLDKILKDERLQVGILADISFKNLLDSFIKYVYVEGGNLIPENQFGLGYINLITIVVELIEYMEKYPSNTFNSKINLISMEEPETHMHPQMQEMIINVLNETFNRLLEKNDRYLNTQILISTHSKALVHSKIRIGDSFNTINFFSGKSGAGRVNVLRDEVVRPEALQHFKYLKRNINQGILDVLFSDAVIVVGKSTEAKLATYYLSEDEKLRHRSVKVLQIGKAYVGLYDNFFKAIGLPTVVLSTIDFQEKYINENRSNRLVSEVLEEVNGDASEFVDALLFKFFVEEEDIPEIPCDLGAAFEYIKNEI